jgi:predicted Fe-Mo cluster-binding NifX family protein
MSSISNLVNPAMLKQAGVDLVIISNGSYNMIQAYRST